METIPASPMKKDWSELVVFVNTRTPNPIPINRNQSSIDLHNLVGK
jgi:hypothetical protein